MKSAFVSGKAGAVWFGVLAGTAMLAQSIAARAQTLMDTSLGVATVVSGLDQPIAMAFIGPNDILVTEKATGRVKRVTNGIVRTCLRTCRCSATAWIASCGTAAP